jgi:hypothetical protein
VLAYAQGGLEARFDLFGQSIGLVGLGAVSTAFTVTLFYVLVLELWKERFGRRSGPFEWFLLAAAAVRMVIMLLPANQWDQVVPPQPWSTLRNLPLMVQGLGVAAFILYDAFQAKDRTFKWIGGMILVSYACYIPVILFVQAAPLVGMLMIPKTMAYVAIGFLAYNDLYRQAIHEPARLVRKSAA